MIDPIYYDNASTTKVDHRVIKEMLPYFSELYGNASSQHEFGKIAKKAIEKSRRQVSSLLNCFEDEIIFTSGATESINLALKGFVEANSCKGNHIITVKTEHKAVLNTCEYLETKGIEVTYLDVDKNGLIDLEDLKTSIQENTFLICIMWVNNETGIIQPIKEIGKIAQSTNITFFSDATQAIGKIPVDLQEIYVDMLCFSGHKLYGPKGIGVLYKKPEIEITPLIHGGGQEKGLRGGTYNSPLIIGLGKACEIAKSEFKENFLSLKTKKEELEKHFTANAIGIVNFKDIETAPHILSITLNNFEADEFLMMKSKEFLASTGSACNSEIIQQSHVLNALKIKNAEKVLRISF
ncbi:cysteine desulfurase family protein [Zunongwangia sp. HGR-M22]|uniref:cysteine desulfurase family protein n=1 Tax=Zunongwangia sp. HGR-M22 TaxID=3015168 RepID=UPI0022DD18E2|nr:cysteine desulfurase family protein [Zunongwangia sp. HGR-M22]WBL25725.1 cysteine desulfurase family protein [Zunongwangia sp. HGR-M22]